MKFRTLQIVGLISLIIVGIVLTVEGVKAAGPCSRVPVAGGTDFTDTLGPWTTIHEVTFGYTMSIWEETTASEASFSIKNGTGATLWSITKYDSVLVAGLHSHTTETATTGTTGSHSHTVTGTTDTEASHTHTVGLQTTSANGAHDHTVSGSTDSTGSHSHTMPAVDTDETGNHRHNSTRLLSGIESVLVFPGENVTGDYFLNGPGEIAASWLWVGDLACTTDLSVLTDVTLETAVDPWLPVVIFGAFVVITALRGATLPMLFGILAVLGNLLPVPYFDMISGTLIILVGLMIHGFVVYQARGGETT